MEVLFNFEKLQVWNNSVHFVQDVYELLKQFPEEEKYGLCSQLRRAAVSVPSNIAEGTSRNSNGDKIHFINIAYGSLMEVFCQLKISAILKLISEEQLNYFRASVTTISKQLSRLCYSYSDQLQHQPKP